MEQVTCKELGVAGCDETFEGTSPGDVVRKAVEHLRDHHDIDLPDAETILEGDMTENPLDPVDEDAALIIVRLREALNLVKSETPETPGLVSSPRDARAS
jgi:predicted small metal-binding protein